MNKKRVKRMSEYELTVSGISSSKAIQGNAYKGSDFSDISESIMSKKELLKHHWILNTMMFQRATKIQEDAYMTLYKVYDEHFSKKSLREKESITENAKVQLTILKTACKEREN